MDTENSGRILRSRSQPNTTVLVKKILGTTTWGKDPPQKVIVVEDENGEMSYLPSVNYQELQPNRKYVPVLYNSNLDQKNCKREISSKPLINNRLSKPQQAMTIQKILKMRYYYIGVDDKSDFIINLLVKKMKVPPIHIYICLKKIKLNNSFRELADEFAMPPMETLKIFYETIPVLAKIMQNFIVKFQSLRNISCIIDCLEIEISKPLDGSFQRLTWSDNKNAHTIKYLISCNPNGLINYVSKGYGGRISDTYLVKTCGFTKHLQKNMSVMVNRDFVNLEENFQKYGVQLLRSTDVLESRIEQQTNIRAYFQTIIRSLRVFGMLRPNACLSHKIVKVLDDVVVIACGLMNLLDNTQPTRRKAPVKISLPLVKESV